MRDNITVLISSVGRRSQLVECFREAFAELEVRGRVIGVDLAPEYAPAAHLLGFVDEVLRIGRSEKAFLIVPTIDTELPVYAATRERFLENGIEVAISDPQTVKIACDKEETHRWLIANGFPTVRQSRPEEVLVTQSQWKLPLILKPRGGSASMGVAKIKSFAALRALAEIQSDSIVQECAEGEEHTINVFVTNGRCLCAVPHRRIETRGGEVSKGVTSRNPKLMELAEALAEH